MIKININKNHEIITTLTQDKEIYSVKVVDSLPEDLNMYVYYYKSGEIIKGEEIDFKILKIRELEKFINDQKEQGFYYNDNRFKLDSVAQNRINMLATNVSLTGGQGMFPLQWFTANGENGTITLNDVNDFNSWYTQATLKILEIETKEANYRYMIEQAQTEEELNNIIFE